MDLTRVWERIPARTRPLIKRSYGAYTRLTAGNRMLPDFVIIGTQRGGTSSLYRYLSQHPQVSPALTKEIFFFDRHYAQGLDWYRSCFPRAQEGVVTGEATPNYMFHPHAVERMANDLGDSVKLIVLLREPGERAYSHWKHQASGGHEALSFRDALDAEPERLDGELERMLDDPSYESYRRHHYSYLARGIYADQLRPWLQRFPADNLLFLRSEDFFAQPDTAFQEVLSFLALDSWRHSSYDVYNARQGKGLDPETRTWLDRYFHGHNARLEALLKRPSIWS